VIVLAVRWYLRFALSYRDVEEQLAASSSRPST
jgi:transposase-like protein